MKHIHILMAASLGILAACTGINEMKDDRAPLEEGVLVERVIFEAPVIRSLGDDDETRASLSQEGENAIRFGWEATDTVGIFPDKGSQVFFEMTNGVGSNVASFDGGGWALKQESTYSCYYPLVGDFYLDRNVIPVSFANQEQKGVSNYEGVRFYLASEGTSSSAGALHFTFQMLNTVIRIKAIGLPAGTYTKLVLTTDEDLFVQEGSFGLEDMTITGKTYSNTMEVTLNNFTLTEESTEANPVLIYLTSAPVDLRGHSITVRVYSEDGSIYKCEKTPPSKAYVSGAWGGLKCTMERESFIISFADPEVKRICVENWDINGDGELSSVEAALTTSIGDVFKGNTELMSFDEFQYFTGVTELFLDEINGTFEGCKNLTSIILPDSIECIGAETFFGCSKLSSIGIPEGVTRIGNSAFSGCSNLHSVVFPESLSSIDHYAFIGCSSLESVFIPDNTTTIGSNIFQSCSGLASIIVSSNNPVYDSRNGCNAIIETSTNTLAFGCQNTIIPDSVTSIGDHAFIGCLGLTEISIPDGVTRIGYAAFRYCKNLSLVLLPESLTSIGNGAFDSCSFTVVNIPNSVTLIEEYAFCGCSKLTTISIPDGITTIEDATFSGCSQLASISIPDGVTTIGDGAFANCFNILSIDIPESVTSIGSRVFLNCRALESVVVNAPTPPTCGSDIFLNQYEDSQFPIYVPSGRVDSYKTAAGWMQYANRIFGNQGGEVPDIPGEEE